MDENDNHRSIRRMLDEHGQVVDAAAPHWLLGMMVSLSGVPTGEERVRLAAAVRELADRIENCTPSKHGEPGLLLDGRRTLVCWGAVDTSCPVFDENSHVLASVLGRDEAGLFDAHVKCGGASCFGGGDTVQEALLMAAVGALAGGEQRWRSGMREYDRESHERMLAKVGWKAA